MWYLFPNDVYCFYKWLKSHNKLKSSILFSVRKIRKTWMPSSHLFKHYLEPPNLIAQLHLRNEEIGSCFYCMRHSYLCFFKILAQFFSVFCLNGNFTQKEVTSGMTQSWCSHLLITICQCLKTNMWGARNVSNFAYWVTLLSIFFFNLKYFPFFFNWSTSVSYKFKLGWT